MQRQCISRLTCGFHGPHGEHFTITKEKFVLYDDVRNKDKNLPDYDIPVIDCDLYPFTLNDRVDSWLIHPLKSVLVDNTDHTLLTDLRKMLDTGQGSDVTLVASDGREFAAHATILSSRTTFFAKIFKHNMQEKKKKTVIIKDLESDANEGLLKFMYTDKVSNITPLAAKLLPKADEYDIPKLKTLCKESMAYEVKSKNGNKFFLLADVHHSSQLHEVPNHFIPTHCKDVKETDGWKRLMSHNP